MKSRWIALSFLFVLVAVPAMAQAPPVPPASLGISNSLSAGAVTPTQDMWFYEQYRRDYQDPKLAIRRRAEFQSWQRQKRIASRKWFGLSNARPRMSADPFHGDSSPRWTGNDSNFPYRFSATGGYWTTYRPEYLGIRGY